MSTHGREGRMPELRSEWDLGSYVYTWREPNKRAWHVKVGDTWLRSDGVLTRYGGPALGWVRVPACECGGEKAKTSHSDWCPRSLK